MPPRRRMSTAVLFLASLTPSRSMVAVSSMPTLPSSALAQLNAKGFAVVENFLDDAMVDLLKDDVRVLNAEGRFGVAGVGEAATNRVADEVRRCEQCFIYPRIKHGGGGNQEAKTALYSVLDSVKDSLEQSTGVALDSLLTEGLYASYPSGGYYRRHIDRVKDTPQDIRRFVCAAPPPREPPCAPPTDD